MRFLLSILLLCPLPDHLQSSFQDALQFINESQTSIQQITKELNCPSDEVLAIVAPELIRYHLLRDFFETQALEIAYTNLGAQAADFSIGQFQMKPSFVEQIEKAILTDSQLTQQFCCLLPAKQLSEKAKRQQRLQQLRTFEYQVKYACAFFAIAEQRFACLDFQNPTDKIQFYAAAYNFGFEQTPAAIRQWAQVAAFPYGRRHQDPQISYGKLAGLFYQSFTQ